MIPYEKRHFDKFGDDGKFMDTKDNCSFYTLYVCWKIGVPQDVIFI